jgi:hypothetical protein
MMRKQSREGDRLEQEGIAVLVEFDIEHQTTPYRVVVVFAFQTVCWILVINFLQYVKFIQQIAD